MDRAPIMHTQHYRGDEDSVHAFVHGCSFLVQGVVFDGQAGHGNCLVQVE
jgi:hypothetical protein